MHRKVFTANILFIIAGIIGGPSVSLPIQTIYINASTQTKCLISVGGLLLAISIILVAYFILKSDERSIIDEQLQKRNRIIAGSIFIVFFLLSFFGSWYFLSSKNVNRPKEQKGYIPNPPFNVPETPKGNPSPPSAPQPKPEDYYYDGVINVGVCYPAKRHEKEDTVFIFDVLINRKKEPIGLRDWTLLIKEPNGQIDPNTPAPLSGYTKSNQTLFIDQYSGHIPYKPDDDIVNKTLNANNEEQIAGEIGFRVHEPSSHFIKKNTEFKIQFKNRLFPSSRPYELEMPHKSYIYVNGSPCSGRFGGFK